MNEPDAVEMPIELANPSNVNTESIEQDLFNKHNGELNSLGAVKSLVSVIIRSMDRPTLSEALDSISSQTYSNIEVVVVNAKGRDHQKMTTSDTRFPLRFVDSDLSLLRSRAANVGLEAARGSHLIFLDDDDWFSPDHISGLMEALMLAPEKKVAYSGVACTGEDKALLGRVFDRPFERTRLLFGNYIPIHAALFSRTLVDSGCRMDESLDLYEDWDFWLQAASLGDFVFVNKITAFYRLGGESGQALHSDPKIVQAVITRLLLKWSREWKGEDLWNIMFRVTRYDEHVKEINELAAYQPKELARQLAELRDQNNSLRHQHTDLNRLHSDLQRQNDILHNQHVDLQQQHRDLERQRNDLELQNESLRSQHAELQQEKISLSAQHIATCRQLDSVMNSNSWKMTAPLRKLRLILSRVFHKST